MKERVLKHTSVLAEQRRRFVEKMETLLVAAFGFVAALAWNEAVKSLFAEGGSLHLFAGYGVWAYAIAITLIAAIVTMTIGKAAEKINGKK